ncbi:glycoside hydrolase family 125 protein [Xylariomycetidae sp. FL2044]|nr:glycoside hydrolase family 125 protein [Xylariomycetidae sp. FL2044]
MLSGGLSLFLVVSALAGQSSAASCPGFTQYLSTRNKPLSTGAYQLAYQRPDPACRTFNSSGVEEAILAIKNEIGDPDLFRLFENTFPNTLDTAIKWHGFAANNSEEELAFVITGDIDAMWIRDSANQIAPYKTVLKSKTDDIAAIFRGVINLQARYLNTAPYCNAFLPPPESGISAGTNGGMYSVTPPYDKNIVFTCNFELDDFGGFLQLSHDYFTATGDLDFFAKFQWVSAIQTIMSTTEELRQPTYDADGRWRKPAYTFQSQTMSAFGTLGNNGMNSPVNYTGMARSPFRPSDDAAMYDFQIPANMMMSRYLETTSKIMEQLPNVPQELAQEMRDMASEIRDAIEHWGVVTAPTGDKIYAYEVDGFGGQNLMDDANIPSLLSAPFLGYLDNKDTIYQNTRNFILSNKNPWWCQGSVISAIGSPHIRPGAAWPMSAIMRAMTTDDHVEITIALKEILRSTDGYGLIHESVDSHDAGRWTRPWFTWANGLFGQLVMDLRQRRPYILKQSFQPLFIERD